MRATITLKDNPDGTVDMSCKFSAPVNLKGPQPPSPATSIACDVMTVLHAHLAPESETTEAQP